MNRKTKAIVASAVLAAGTAAGFTAYGWKKEADHRRWKTEQTSLLVDKFQNCPNPKSIPYGCFDTNEAAAKTTAAKMHEANKKYKAAGLIYAELGNSEMGKQKNGEVITAIAKAREMAELCKKDGDAEGYDQIIEKIDIIATGLSEYRTPKKEPATSPSGSSSTIPAPSSSVSTESIRQRQYPTSVQELVERFKACPEPAEIARGCFDKNEREIQETAAKMNEDNKNYSEAGIIYANLGNSKKAREMADLCKKTKDTACYDRVVAQINMMAAALKEYQTPLKK